MTKDYMTGLLQQNVITVLCTAPSILNDMSKTETGIEVLSKLNHVSYGGGPLPEQAGKILASRLKHLWSMIGSTENGFYSTIPGDNSKWDCIKFNTKVGYRFDEISPGIFELVVPFNSTTRKYHGSVLLFPEMKEYSTKDLWMKADGEDSQGWWRYVGRRDDLIVLSNGEKINPRPLEDTIGNHPAVKGVLVVGEYRFLPSLLVELEDGYSVTTKEERETMVDMLWDTISQANLQAPRFSRVPKSLVYVISSTEAFNRAGKGTIQRQSTVQKFAAQVDELYSSAEEGLLADGLELSDPSDLKCILNMVKSLYSQVLETDKLGDDDDIFELGMDSLQVTIVVQRLKAVLRTCKLSLDYDKINPQVIYSSVSIRGLAHAMDTIINAHEGENGVHTSATSVIKERNSRLQTTIDKYSAGLDATLPAKKVQQDNLTVILTGSTGSLGSYLLHFLLLNPRVAKVVCLNRSVDAEARQTAGNKSRDLPILWTAPDIPKQVEFFIADMSKADLGLGESVYSRLLSETNAIIHSAWKVDFNHRIESFEKGHIAGTRHFIDFSNKCVHKAPILFVSSISTVLNWVNENPGQLVPEAMIHDLSAPELMGYGESKYVGERLIESFNKFSGTPCAVLRVGQIAGPVLSTAGSWNAHEWFPSLLASSKYLGLLPDSLGAMNTVSWVPVDILAKVIVQLMDVTYGLVGETGNLSIEEPAVYNLVNPQISVWSDLIKTVQEGLGGPLNIKVVSFGEWVEALARSTNDNHGFVVETNPATKLLDFFRLISRDSHQLTSEKGNEKLEYQVERLKKDSSEAAQLGPVSPEWVKIWLKQWAF
jgi:thioester reductase-like protein